MSSMMYLLFKVTWLMNSTCMTWISFKCSCHYLYLISVVILNKLRSPKRSALALCAMTNEPHSGQMWRATILLTSVLWTHRIHLSSHQCAEGKLLFDIIRQRCPSLNPCGHWHGHLRWWGWAQRGGLGSIQLAFLEYVASVFITWCSWIFFLFLFSAEDNLHFYVVTEQ